MDEFLNRLIADGIVATDDAVQAHSAEILGRAKDLVAAAAAQVKTSINSAISSDDLGFLGNPIKPALIKAIDNFVDNTVSDFNANEAAWLQKIVAAAQQYAVKING